MIDPMKDKLISFLEAARLIKARVSDQTIALWHRDGIRGVRLEAVTIGRRKFTTEAAVRAFLAATQDRQPVQA